VAIDAARHRNPQLLRVEACGGGPTAAWSEVMNHKAIIAVGSLMLCSVAPVASAHISLERGGTHRSRHGDADLKEGPCGKAGAGGQRGTNIYTYTPGQTITVTFSEYIAHTSYFRFAFDNDGDDGFVDPVSILPIDPARGCPFVGANTTDAANDQCNASDFYNNATVLPDMDNLDPHITGLFPAKTWTYQVTLPNVECNNCTLQVIQVMQDPPGHGPFDGNADIYHQCIDLVLTNGGGSGGAGGNGGASGSAGAGGVGGAGGGGVGGAGGAAGMAGAGAVGGTGGAGGVGAGAGGAAGTAGSGSGAGGFGGAPAKKDSGCSVAAGRGNASSMVPMLFGLLGVVIIARRRRESSHR